MNIHSIETFGTHEGPGLRFVIFVQGCNWKCLYCHNPDSQNQERNKVVSVESLIEMIEKNRPYFGEKGGVTVSGGEPLLQAKELATLFQKLKELKIRTALDTNGSILNDETKKLLGYTDLVLLDIKQIDPEWHEEITNYKLQITKKNSIPSIEFLGYLESIGKPTWIRYVLVPGYSDQPVYLRKLASILQKYKVIEKIEILPYHTLGQYKYEELGLEYKLKDVEPPAEIEIGKAKKILEASCKKVSVR